LLIPVQLARAVREAVGGAPEPRYEEARPGDVRHSLADGSLSERGLGFVPEVELSEGLAKAFRHYAAVVRGESADASVRSVARLNGDRSR
jgi:nucleoside-diphosphate-sugar epimerase